MFTLRVKTHFDAAHLIKDYEGKCSNLHGHRWDIEVAITGTTLNECNILVDFTDVKSRLSSMFESQYDHKYLNDSLGADNITAEYIARRIFNALRDHFHLDSVTVWESPECSVEYRL